MYASGPRHSRFLRVALSQVPSLTLWDVRTLMAPSQGPCAKATPKHIAHLGFTSSPRKETKGNEIKLGIHGPMGSMDPWGWGGGVGWDGSADAVAVAGP